MAVGNTFPHKAILVVLTVALLLAYQVRPVLAAQNSDAACASCHRKIFEQYEKTPMAHASGRASDGVIPGAFTHPASGIHYRLFLEDGHAWLSYERASIDASRELKGKEELLYFLGSGTRGRTYLSNREGYWFESPVNWYGKKQVWDMAPNYLNAREMPFTLPVDPGCLHCHATGVQPSLPQARNRFAGEPFLHGGITCESCHGDSAAHLNQGRQGPILNPAKLESVRRDSVCLTCHLEGEVAVVRRGRELAAFRPGDNLFDYAVYFVHKQEAGPTRRATSQWEALLESACKRKSGDALTCTTCHDPHRSVDAGERVTHYRNKCLSCHSDPDFVAKHHPENQDCVSCHMPRQTTEDIAHEQVTDHRIQRRPGLAFESAIKSDELATIGGVEADDRDFGLAYAQMAERGNHYAGVRALRLLHAAEMSNTLQESDTELHTQLGFLEQLNGDKKQATEEYTTALKENPLNGTAAGDLALLQAQSGDFLSASRLWGQVFENDPAQLAAGMNLAVAQCTLGDAAAATRTLQRLLVFSPDNAQARQFIAAMANGSHRCEKH
jgi:predicted CXXCH cytochrome family protein